MIAEVEDFALVGIFEKGLMEEDLSKTRKQSCENVEIAFQAQGTGHAKIIMRERAYILIRERGRVKVTG